MVLAVEVNAVALVVWCSSSRQDDECLVISTPRASGHLHLQAARARETFTAVLVVATRVLVLVVPGLGLGLGEVARRRNGL